MRDLRFLGSRTLLDLISSIDKRNQATLGLAGEMLNSPVIQAANEIWADRQRMGWVGSSLAESLKETSDHMLGCIRLAKQYGALAQIPNEVKLETIVDMAKGLPSIIPADPPWVSIVCRFSVAGDIALTRVGLLNDKHNLGLQEAIGGGEAFLSSAWQVARSYADHLTWLTESTEDAKGLSDLYTTMPAKAQFLSAAVTEALLIPREIEPDEDYYEGMEDLKNEALDEDLNELLRLINSIDLDLGQMLLGARNALESEGPDHLRHHAVSLRGVIDRVIERLASDTKVLEWNPYGDEYLDDRGEPTRRLRLKYLCRRYQDRPFCSFAEDQVSLVVKTMQYLSDQVHRPKSKFSLEEARLFHGYAEYSLKFIIQAGMEQ